MALSPPVTTNTPNVDSIIVLPKDIFAQIGFSDSTGIPSVVPEIVDSREGEPKEYNAINSFEHGFVLT